jgi:hypothetical protein
MEFVISVFVVMLSLILMFHYCSKFVTYYLIIRQIKSRRMRWAGHVARMGEGRNVYRVLVGKPEGKRLLGRPRHRWEDGIKMDLREIGWEGGGVVSPGSG